MSHNGNRVNLVIVSHSHRLAEGVRELAEQMASSEVQIAAVGGLVDESGSSQLGTDPVAIAQAIEQVWNQHSVLLLVDVGSAVLSAELALDLLPAQIRQGCKLSNAPLVEGAIVAAVEASLGHNLSEVNRAAEAAHTLQKVIG